MVIWHLTEEAQKQLYFLRKLHKAISTLSFVKLYRGAIEASWLETSLYGLCRQELTQTVSGAHLLSISDISEMCQHSPQRILKHNTLHHSLFTLEPSGKRYRRIYSCNTGLQLLPSGPETPEVILHNPQWFFHDLLIHPIISFFCA